jgi:hypothetical protein
MTEGLANAAVMSDAESAKDYMRIYADDPTKDSGYCWMAPINGGYVGLTKRAGVVYVDWRGSTTPKDWLWNFEADPTMDGSLGMLHKGFAKGVWAVQDTVTAQINSMPCVVRGHSRGAAQAAIFAGHLTVLKHAPLRVVLWGCPRPGFSKLKELLAPIPVASYKNLNDPVTDVPFCLDLPGHALDLPYEHVRRFTQLTARPNVIQAVWGLLAPHHMELYAKGLEQLSK